MKSFALLSLLALGACGGPSYGTQFGRTAVNEGDCLVLNNYDSTLQSTTDCANEWKIRHGEKPFELRNSTTLAVAHDADGNETAEVTQDNDTGVISVDEERPH